MLTGAQEIGAQILEGARTDLRRRPSCWRHQLARAWIEERYPCGCPYEGPGLEFPLLAALLKQEPERLREMIVNGHRRELHVLCRRT
jgi:hypothetical protein